MKILAKKEELCTACHDCEIACSKIYFKEENVLKASLRIIQDDHNKISITTCNQCGKCIEVCPTQALFKDKKGIVRMKKKDCVGSLMCVSICPEDAMFQLDSLVEPFKCNSCGVCVDACSTGAIFMKEI